MKKLLAPITVAVMLSMWVLTAGCEREWTGTVEGVITDTETEEGIEDVLVTARSEKNGCEVSVLTDAAGEYAIDDARWGPNLISVYHPRYEEVSKYADVIRDKSVELDFEIDRLEEYVDPVLTVTVINPNGDPVNAAVLDLYELKESTYAYYFYIGTQVTEEDGQAIFILPRMYEDEVIQYQIRAAAFGYEDQVKDFALSWTVPEPELTITMEGI